MNSVTAGKMMVCTHGDDNLSIFISGVKISSSCYNYIKVTSTTVTVVRLQTINTRFDHSSHNFLKKYGSINFNGSVNCRSFTIDCKISERSGSMIQNSYCARSYGF